MNYSDIMENYGQVGAFLVLLVFLGGALVNIFDRERAVQFLESKGYTENAGLVLAIGVLWQIAGSVLILNPTTMIYGCLLLILFTLFSTLQFYPFWKMRGVERYMNIILFRNNLGVMGGLLLLLNQNQHYHHPFNWMLFHLQ